MRKAFNFYRSYYDVAKQLTTKDREKFLMALLEKQFDGKEPNLDGMAKFAYLSQQHSIDSQVAGYEAKTKTILGGAEGGAEGGSGQEKGEEKGQVQYVIDFTSLLSFINKSTGRNFKVINKGVKNKFIARLKDGYTKQDIFTAITESVKTEYHKENNFQYLTPEFFSRSSTLDKYSNTTKQPKQNSAGLPDMDYIKQQIALNNDTKQGK